MKPVPWVLNFADNCLTALIYMDVLDSNLLLSFTAVPIERFEKCGERSGKLARLVEIFTPEHKVLIGQHCTPVAFHRCVVSRDKLRSNHSFKFVFWFDANQSHYCSLSFGARIAVVGSGDSECVHCLISNYPIREKVILFQEECYRVLYQHFSGDRDRLAREANEADSLS